jgi:tetratricopeptide (TPR) repeat protein
MVQLRYRPAYVCLKRWIELRPDVPRAYQWRAWVTERLDNHKLAAADYARAIEIDPDLVFSRLRLAELHLEDRAVSDAVPHLERLYATNATNPMVRSRLGVCRFLQGNAAEARRLMEGAVGELPDDPQLLLYLGRLEIQEGRYAEAEKWLRRILVSDPTDNEARYALVNVYQLQGRTADAAVALKEYEEAKARLLRVNALLKDVVDRPTATADEFAEVGEFLLVLGRTEVARYWLDRALQRDPAHARAKAALARCAEQKARTDPKPPVGP